ncbi:MAG: hypothetical protein Q9175_000717 [Cornicularia normoerica]
MSSGLMDTEAGGEGSQYAVSNLVAQQQLTMLPDTSQSRQSQNHTLSKAVKWAVSAVPALIATKEETQPDAVTSQQKQQKAEREGKTAENVRYGQTISEEGMGGKTTEAGGSANQDGFGVTDAQGGIDDAEESRRNQGYGPGSGVGA